LGLWKLGIGDWGVWGWGIINSGFGIIFLKISNYPLFGNFFKNFKLPLI
jgi:hypothetical protein